MYLALNLFYQNGLHSEFFKKLKHTLDILFTHLHSSIDCIEWTGQHTQTWLRTEENDLGQRTNDYNGGSQGNLHDGLMTETGLHTNI